VFRSHYPFNYGYTESTVDAMKLLQILCERPHIKQAAPMRAE